MALKIYNSLTKRMESFVPLDPQGKRVTFYTCGPTVYDYAHIGNFRSFLVADVLRRSLELLGYEVTHVMNITDVGHMTDDEVADGAGEDKMEVAAARLLQAKKAGTLPPGTDVDPSDPYAIADFYADAFLNDARNLGLKVAIEGEQNPELLPRPTQYITQMIDLVEILIARDHAYIADDGVVYFNVQSFPEYGRLSGNTLDQLRGGAGGRVQAATQQLKKHPADFMLWKPDPAHIMKWPSPWGDGYPGWHLECSVMAQSLLGTDTGGVIDIHSGGEDNLFPHHECEIAQACCATGQEYFARYWLHGRHLMVEGEKMSKSAGNFFTIGDVISRGASPAAIRLELIKTHYRSNANFTFQGLKDAQRQIDRWLRLRNWLKTHRDVRIMGNGALTDAMDSFEAALADDLNIAGAIGVLSEAASQYRIDAPPELGDGPRTLNDELTSLLAMDGVLGVLDLDHTAVHDTDGVDVELIAAKIAERVEARANKDWAEADRIRDELLEMGIEIKDGPEGTTWKRIVR